MKHRPRVTQEEETKRDQVHLQPFTSMEVEGDFSRCLAVPGYSRSVQSEARTFAKGGIS